MKLKRYISRYLRINRYLSNSNIDTSTVEVESFRMVRLDDPQDKKYKAWSRAYEYPLVVKILLDRVEAGEASIHNTSWGFQSIHVDFKNYLENVFGNVVNTDILQSHHPNTKVLDITNPPPPEYLSKFDGVINVSTVEEVDADHLQIIEYLLMQVKTGGYLVLTFDIPGMQIRKIEKIFKMKISCSDYDISGENSIFPDKRYASLRCGVLVIKKK